MTSLSSRLAFFENKAKSDTITPKLVRHRKKQSQSSTMSWAHSQPSKPKITSSYSPPISMANDDEKMDEYVIWTQYIDKNGHKPSSAFQLAAFTNKTDDLPSIDMRRAKIIVKKYQTTEYHPVSKPNHVPKMKSWRPVQPRPISSTPFNGLAKGALCTGVCQICLEEKENILTTSKCGHKLCKTCMRMYIKSASNKLIIQCPQFECSSLLSQYYDIKCVLTNGEYSKMYLKDVLRNLSSRYHSLLKQMCLTKTCFHEIPSDQIIGGKFECCDCNQSWCIDCRSPWHEGFNCDESYSDKQNAISDILLNCALITIGYVSNVPSTRSCPNCNEAITHNSGCKHMHCIRCGTNFCFVCLVVYDASSGWECGGSSDVCTIAPRQVVMVHDQQNN
eukprot:272244_1